jgi:hypothetical protein
MKTGKFNVFENFLSFSSIFGFHHWASLTPFSIIFLIVTVLTLFLKKTEIDAPLKKILWASIGLIFLFTFLLTPQSHWIWKYLSFYRILGFPWRLLSPITFLLCFSAGIIPYLVSQSNHQKILLFSLIFLALFSFLTKYQYSNPQYVDVNQVDLSAQAIRNHRHRTTVYSEYRPIWAKNREKPRNVFFHSYNKEVLINHRVQKTHRHQVQIVNPNDKTTILININFFPGWKVYKNEIPLTTRINSLGLIEFDLPKGNHVIDVFFENSIIRYWGNMLFLFGIGCLVLGTLIWILRTEKKPAF